MSLAQAPRAAKKATNVSINADLLAKARTLNINLSATLEQALLDTVKQHQRAQWLAENHAAMAAYNESVERSGIFSDGVRSF